MLILPIHLLLLNEFNTIFNLKKNEIKIFIIFLFFKMQANDPIMIEEIRIKRDKKIERNKLIERFERNAIRNLYNNLDLNVSNINSLDNNEFKTNKPILELY